MKETEPVNDYNETFEYLWSRTRKIPLAEQIELIKTKVGTPEWRDLKYEITINHLPLIVHVLKHYAKAHEFVLSSSEVQDVVSVAVIEVADMLHNFDPERGFQLSTYLYRVIRSRLKTYFYKQSKNGFTCVSREILASKNLRRDTLPLVDRRGTAISLPVDSDEPMVAERLDNVPKLDRLRVAVAQLSSDDRRMLEGMMNRESGTQLANALGVTRQAVNQQRTRILRYVAMFVLGTNDPKKVPRLSPRKIFSR